MVKDFLSFLPGPIGIFVIPGEKVVVWWVEELMSGLEPLVSYRDTRDEASMTGHVCVYHYARALLRASVARGSIAKALYFHYSFACF